MVWIYMTICLVLYAVLPETTLNSMGVSNDSMLCAYTYMFSHSSWLHIIINIFSLSLIWVGVKRVWERKYNSRFNGVLMFAVCYIASALAGLICATDIPTVGASGMVFFLLGLLLMLNPTKRQALNYLWIAAAVAVQWYFGKSNVALHIVSFAEGALFVIVKEFIRRYKSDEY